MLKYRILLPVVLPLVCVVFAGEVMAQKCPVALAKAGWNLIPSDGVIKAPGKYLLQEDMNTNRKIGIKIEADDVVVDLNGKTLRYTESAKEGTLGIVASGKKNITLTNGVVGGFWYNTHFTQNQNLKIENAVFDDILWIGINIAQSKNVQIYNNQFKNFRYDVKKSPEEKIKYLVGINIGAEDAIISNNSFQANPPGSDYEATNTETVFILFSAKSQRCIVGLNKLDVSRALPHSYGVWVANNAQATIIQNDIRNLQYGVCVGGKGSALVGYNNISINVVSDPPKDITTYGVSAGSPKEATVIYNTIEGFSKPINMPKTFDSQNNTIK